MLYDLSISNLERETRPLNGPGSYRVAEGLVWTRAIEINATRHCNLSCEGCSHAAPIAKRTELDATVAYYDLHMLSNYMRCETIRIVGGEPLLHSDFFGFVQAVKCSGISKQICLVTNGLLLRNIDNRFLNYIDEIEVSLYPLSENVRNSILRRTERLNNLGLRTHVLNYSSFRFPFAQNRSDNDEVVRLIYSTCQIAHFWRCITVDNGFIYRCPQSLHFTEKYSNSFRERLPISSITDYNDVLVFLENNEPIGSCWFCLGSVGRLFPHRQISEKDWEHELPQKPDDKYDADYLRTLLDDLHMKNGCMTRDKEYEKG